MLRVSAWVNRFINNCRKTKVRGLLTTREIEKQKKFWIKREQHRFRDTEKVKIDVKSLDLQENSEGILVCRGRIEGAHPIYIPKESPLAEKIIFAEHKKTLHGGVTITMTSVRSTYWIPSLRQQTKSVIRKCYGCKKYRALPYPTPKPGPLPPERTELAMPFQTIGTDYAGPIYYRTKSKKESKAYILLFACSVSRAVHLELAENLTSKEFIKCFKRLIARRGRPKLIYSDNAKTFQAAAKWLKQVTRDEELHEFLIKENISWRFNLSRAPWWGGQFERLIGITKQALHKSLGKTNLYWNELEEVLLDIEINMNNRPLTYIEDDIQYPVLTPNSMILGRDTAALQENPKDEDESDWKKRQRYIKRCKEAAWRRWQREYITALRGKHDMKHKSSEKEIKVGEIVMVKGEDKRRGTWKIGRVDELFVGKDGITRGVRIKTARGFLERPVQLLYPLELHCDVNTNDEIQLGKTKDGNENVKLNPEASTFRPKRTAAAIASIKLNDMIDDN